MNKRKIYAVIFGLLTIGITAFIIFNSLKTGEESGKMSNVFVVILNGLLGLFGIEADNDVLSLIIRKTAHFSEYFALGAVFTLFITNLSRVKILISLSAVYCFITAICDEFLVQASTIGREPSWIDVSIDSAGAIIGTAFVALIIYLTERKSIKNG